MYFVKALKATDAPDISGKVVGWQENDVRIVADETVSYFEKHPDVFSVIGHLAPAAFARDENGAEGLIGTFDGIRYVPYVLAQAYNLMLLPACAADSTAAQAEGATIVTVTNGGGVPAAHNIPATTYDGALVYFPGSASFPAGWYPDFARTGANTYTFDFGQAPDEEVLAEPVNAGAAFTDETVAVTISVPGGALGANGSLRAHVVTSSNNSAGDKTATLKYAGDTLHAGVITTEGGGASGIAMQNANSLQLQVTSLTTAAAGAPTRTAADSSVDQDFVITLQLETASDYVALESYTIEVIPS